MKLIFSMPGVPSATPAHEKSAWTGPPHSSTAASIEAVSARLTWMALAPAQLDLGEVHHHDLGAGVLHQLGRRRAHAGGAADHEDALAVVPKCVEQCHVLSPD